MAKELCQLEAGSAEVLEHALGVVLLSNLAHEVEVFVSVGGEGVLVTPGVVGVLPVLVETKALGVVVDLHAELADVRKEDFLVGLCVDSQGDEPHESGAVGDDILEAENVATGLGAVLDNGLRDRLELDEGVKVGIGGGSLHLGRVILQLIVDKLEHADIVSRLTDEPVGAGVRLVVSKKWAIVLHTRDQAVSGQ